MHSSRCQSALLPSPGCARRVDRPHPRTGLGYLLASLVVLPLAVGWPWAERSRGGTATILIGLVVVPYLFVRLYQVWVLGQ